MCIYIYIYIYIYKYYERKKGRNYIPLLFHAKIDLQTSIYIYIQFQLLSNKNTSYNLPQLLSTLPH